MVQGQRISQYEQPQVGAGHLHFLELRKISLHRSPVRQSLALGQGEQLDMFMPWVLL